MLASGQARKRRESLCMSLREVAAAMGKDPGSLSRWESGEVQPRAQAALQLADILGITGAQRQDQAA